MKKLSQWLVLLVTVIIPEALVALLTVLLLPILLLLVLLLLLWALLLSLFKKKKKGEKKKPPCSQLPESIIRRPDPCLYDQFLLESKGLPVTWNNPDIWLARADNPTAIEPDSYHLQADTDYVVTVRVHNASLDAGIGVRVRLTYRLWSFNTPDFVPVEMNAGQEVFRWVDVLPLGSTNTTFQWRTPKVDPAIGVQHYCLQASVEHPMDSNLGNNVGQENTNVYSANPGHVSPGEVLKFEVPLHNPHDAATAFAFAAHLYDPRREDSFKLKRRVARGRMRWSLAQKIANFRPTMHPQPRGGRRGNDRSPWSRLWGRFEWVAQRPVKVVKAKYEGFDAIRADILARDVSLPAGMTITVDGNTLAAPLTLEPKETRALPFVVTVPNDAVPGTELPLTILARFANGMLAGGVTMLLRVKEGA